MYEQVLQQIGLTKNESIIYETLIREGESGVGRIAAKSRIHRRNIYDAMGRLIELGLVYEILARRERTYQAASPDRLFEILDEQQAKLAKVLPALEFLYRKQPREQRVAIYRGPEGWKNYMRDMLREADEAHFIAAKGGWLDDRVKHFFPYFDKEAKRKGIRFYHLFDHEVQEKIPQILPHVGTDYKFFPRGYSAQGAVDIFGDHVNLLSDVRLGAHGDEIRFVVIVNQQVAEAFRTWFRFLWSICPE